MAQEFINIYYIKLLNIYYITTQPNQLRSQEAVADL